MVVVMVVGSVMGSVNERGGGAGCDGEGIKQKTRKWRRERGFFNLDRQGSFESFDATGNRCYRFTLKTARSGGVG